jgi:hypothetical protein
VETVVVYFKIMFRCLHAINEENKEILLYGYPCFGATFEPASSRKRRRMINKLTGLSNGCRRMRNTEGFVFYVAIYG